MWDVHPMAKFIGKIAVNPELRDGKWYFSIWNEKDHAGINCISSVRFEVENRDVPFNFKPHELVEVIGDVRAPGTLFFEQINLLKKAEATAKAG
jgi:hypothetical protein